MKKLTFSDGSVGYRDKGTWLDVEGLSVVQAEPSIAGVEAIRPAPIELVEDKRYDESKPIVKDDHAANSR